MDTPIDIKYNELLKFLTERFFIPNDWTTRLEVIVLKKQEVMDELYLKETEEFKKIQNTFKAVRHDMNYQDIMKLYQMLQKTEEAKDKTFFGNYNSNLIKNCYLLVNLYEKNLMHLCESSKLITQNVAYDIPNLEKTIHSNEKQINEISGKIQDRNSAIIKNNEKLNNLFKSFNIKNTENSNDIALNLIERLPSLKSQVENIEKKLKRKQIETIIQAYKNFYKKINGKEIDKTDDFMTVLQKITKEGDYIISNNNNKISNERKYDIITTKFEELKSKYQNLNIKADLNSDIWNFQLVEGDNSINYSTALLNFKARKLLIDDLNELLIFVNHRSNFCNNKDEVSLSIYQGNIREINNELNQDLLKESKKNLEEILNDLNGKDFELLSGIFEDEKKIKSILNSFESVKTENSNLNKNVNESKNKSSELEKESSESNKKIDSLKKEAKMVKKFIEKILTDKMKRKINIIGDANLF
jgi:hypothetical protein